MTQEQLKQTLCKYGNPLIVKEGYVFTVCIIGNNLSNWKYVNDIQKHILEYVGEKYPIIEVFVNNDEFFFFILRPTEQVVERKILEEHK